MSDVFPSVRRVAGVARWFYLRYLDDGGFHLRLRLEAEHADRVPVSEGTEHILQALFLAGTARPPSYAPSYKPMLSLGSNPITMVEHSSRLEKDEYTPEDAVFGSENMRIAERLFEASSEIAMQVIIDEQALAYSRKTLAPIFMKDALHTLGSGKASALFWEDYASYWLKYDKSAVDWPARFHAKWMELSSLGVPVSAPDAALPTAALLRVHDWRTALVDAAKAYASIEAPSVKRADRAAPFIHLMNNRLGITLLEESYLSTLLHLDEVARE